MADRQVVISVTRSLCRETIADQMKVHEASKNGNIVSLKMLLGGRVDDERKELVNRKTHKVPPLVIAARYGHADIIYYLVQCGADIHGVGEVRFDGEPIDSAPAIWAAAAAGHIDAVQALIQLGADVNQTTKSNSTALRGACFDGHLEVVQILLRNGADLEIANTHAHTPLMIAAYRGKLAVVRYLLHCGALVNRMSDKGNTALHDAAEFGSVPIVKELLAHGAYTSCDGHQLTPIMTSALLGHKAAVDFLAWYLRCCNADKMEQRRAKWRADSAKTLKDSLSPPEYTALLKYRTDRMNNEKQQVQPSTSFDEGAESPATADQSHKRSTTNKYSFCKLVRADCNLHEIADAYKLLGCTIVDKKRDLAKALTCWKLGIEAARECPDVDCMMRQKKKEVPPREVYQNQVELHRVDEVDELAGDADRIRMQSLVLRERILGVRHPETFYYLRYRGAVYADKALYDRSYQMWKYALDLQQRSLLPLNVMTLISIGAFVEVFTMMVEEYSYAQNQGDIDELHTQMPRAEYLVAIMESAVNEIERHIYGDVPSLADVSVHEQNCEDCAPKDPELSMYRLVVNILHLTCLLGQLERPQTLRFHRDEEQMTMPAAVEHDVLKQLSRLLHLAPQLQLEQSIVHVAADPQANHTCKSQIQTEGIAVYHESKHLRLPSSFVIEQLVRAGASYAALDQYKRTPLHYIARIDYNDRTARVNIAHTEEAFKKQMTHIVKRMLDAGAHLDQKDRFGETPMYLLGIGFRARDTPSKKYINKPEVTNLSSNNASCAYCRSDAHRIVTCPHFSTDEGPKPKVNINPLDYVNLRCMAAMVVSSNVEQVLDAQEKEYNSPLVTAQMRAHINSH